MIRDDRPLTERELDAVLKRTTLCQLTDNDIEYVFRAVWSLVREVKERREKEQEAR